MLRVTQRLLERRAVNDRLVLPFELRQKSRLRAQLASGTEAGLFLERGSLLRGGDLLLAENGAVIEVVAAEETLSTVRSSNPSQLARAGYHLGNRHVAVQIGDGWLRYRHDHVLDDMVQGLGLPVQVEQAPFEPEGGAYAHGHHSHGERDHEHSHGHESGADSAPPQESHTHSHGEHGREHSHGHEGRTDSASRETPTYSHEATQYSAVAEHEHWPLAPHSRPHE